MKFDLLAVSNRKLRAWAVFTTLSNREMCEYRNVWSMFIEYRLATRVSTMTYRTWYDWRITMATLEIFVTERSTWIIRRWQMENDDTNNFVSHWVYFVVISTLSTTYWCKNASQPRLYHSLTWKMKIHTICRRNIIDKPTKKMKDQIE